MYRSHDTRDEPCRRPATAVEPECEQDLTITNDTWTVGRLLNWTADYFARKGVDEPRLSTEVLLAHAMGCRRIDLYARFDQPLTGDPLAKFRSLVTRAADHEPFAYLVGEKEFYALAFHVSPAVLIPRPETETLVESAIDLCTSSSLDAPRILDLGTGSGCIAVALATQIPTARIVATDVSTEALAVARSNAERHGVLDRVHCVEVDRLDLPGGVVPDGGFDIIISNPPYVASSEMATLDETVRAFEPGLALTDGADGLSFYRCLAEGAANIVRAAGYVLLEVADGQASAVVEVMLTGSGLAHVRTIRDRVTRRERVAVFVRRA